MWLSNDGSLPVSSLCAGGEQELCPATEAPFALPTADLTTEACTTVNVGNPPGSCESHEECAGQVTVGDCGVARCNNGACVQDYAPLGSLCRAADTANFPCDAPEVRAAPVQHAASSGACASPGLRKGCHADLNWPGQRLTRMPALL